MMTAPTTKYREEQEIEKALEVGLRSWMNKAVLSGVAFALSVGSVVPFLYGHAFHDHWQHVGKYLVMLAMLLLTIFLFAVGNMCAFWLQLREIRRISEH